MTAPDTRISPLTTAPGFTEQEIAFFRAYVQTGSQAEAAILSGIPYTETNTLLYTKKAGAILQSEVDFSLSHVSMPRAAARLAESLERGAKPDRGQMDAAKTVLAITGHIAPKASDAIKLDLGLQEMNEAQLREVLNMATGELDKLGVPHEPPIEGQVIDMLD